MGSFMQVRHLSSKKDWRALTSPHLKGARGEDSYQSSESCRCGRRGPQTISTCDLRLFQKWSWQRGSIEGDKLPNIPRSLPSDVLSGLPNGQP